MLYLVSWTIDVEADSPLEAAREAQRIQRNPESTATVFIVRPTHLRSAVSEMLDLEHHSEG